MHLIVYLSRTSEDNSFSANVEEMLEQLLRNKRSLLWYSVTGTCYNQIYAKPMQAP